MKWGPVFLLGGLSALAVYAVAEAVFPSSAVRENDGVPGAAFPEVSGANLEGKRYDLPRDFEGDVNLCLIAFTREQQADVDTWLEGVKPYSSVPGFRVYELPVVAKGNPAFRAFLDNAMKNGIPSADQRAHTITLYVDKAKFRACLGLPDEGQIYAVLTDRAGRVLWRAEGRFTEERGRALHDAAEFHRDA